MLVEFVVVVARSGTTEQQRSSRDAIVTSFDAALLQPMPARQLSTPQEIRERADALAIARLKVLPRATSFRAAGHCCACDLLASRTLQLATVQST